MHNINVRAKLKLAEERDIPDYFEVWNSTTFNSEEQKSLHIKYWHSSWIQAENKILLTEIKKISTF